jgi:hypothetical protein
MDLLKTLAQNTRHLIGPQMETHFNFKAAFFIPNYCDKFQFQGQFIGHKGKGIRQIKEICGNREGYDPKIEL